MGSGKRMAVVVIALLLALLLSHAATACGDDSGITSDDHARIKVGMTMDEVESILGQPERSHVTGASQEQIFWYYTKTDGEGLVKISFDQGKVSSIAPYDQSFEVGE